MFYFSAHPLTGRKIEIGLNVMSYSVYTRFESSHFWRILFLMFAYANFCCRSNDYSDRAENFTQFLNKFVSTIGQTVQTLN